MKFFISQPMSGRTVNAIMKEREQVEKILREKFPLDDVEIVDNYHPDKKGTPIELLGESIKAMSGADYVVFTPHYHKARGCRVEEDVARWYKIKTVYLTYKEMGL